MTSVILKELNNRNNKMRRIIILIEINYTIKI